MTADRRSRALSAAVYVAITAIGLAAFLYPFWLPQEAAPTEAQRRLDGAYGLSSRTRRSSPPTLADGVR